MGSLDPSTLGVEHRQFATWRADDQAAVEAGTHLALTVDGSAVLFTNLGVQSHLEVAVPVVALTVFVPATTISPDRGVSLEWGYRRVDGARLVGLLDTLGGLGGGLSAPGAALRAMAAAGNPHRDLVWPVLLAVVSGNLSGVRLDAAVAMSAAFTGTGAELLDAATAVVAPPVGTAGA